MATTINANNTDGVVITPDTSGELELQANGVTKAKVTANGLQDANGNSLRGGMYRNLIINGDMQIAQRGTSVTGITGTGYQTVDRWQTYNSSGGTWTDTQSTDVPIGQGFAFSKKLQCTGTATLGTSNISQLTYRLEGQFLQHLKFGTSSAESLTLSFWVKSNKTGTFVVEPRSVTTSVASYDVGLPYTINSADTWEKKTFTISGNTLGDIRNTNTDGFALYFWLVAGTNFTSGTTPTTWQILNNPDRAAGQTVNLADSTSNYINITGVQLEVGEGASDFEFLPYDVQLARCQRYFRTVGDGMIGRANSSTNIYFSHHFETPMREIPAMSLATTTIRWGNFYSYDKTSSGAAVGLPRSSINAVVGWVTGYSGLTTADMMQAWQNNPPGWLYCDAEL